MKPTQIGLALLLALHPSCPAQQSSPITLFISTPTPSAQTGKRIQIDVTVTNNAGHPIKLIKALGDDGQTDAANLVEVRNAEGVKLDPIARNRWLSRKRVPLEEGRSFQDYLTLTNLFNLSKPGQYTVVLRHELLQPEAEHTEDRKMFVPSNQLTIAILPY